MSQAPPITTVEALVRRRLADSLGGRRGLAEAMVPGLAFTLVWLIGHDLQVAVGASAVVAVAFLVARLVQRQTTQYTVNAIIGVALGWVFVRWAENAGGSESDQALAFFLPGLVISSTFTVLYVGSCLIGWPVVGFALGNATEDPFAWHEDAQVVRLCSRLTYVLAAPGAIGVLLQGPVWLLGWREVIDPDVAVGIITGLRFGLAWVLRLGAASMLVWLLGRNATPLTGAQADPA